MVHAEERSVGAKFLGCDRQVDGLQKRVGRRSRLRMRRRGPVSEREEADLFHETCMVRDRLMLLMLASQTMQPKADETLAQVAQPLVAAAAHHRKPVKQEIREEIRINLTARPETTNSI